MWLELHCCLLSKNLISLNLHMTLLADEGRSIHTLEAHTRDVVKVDGYKHSSGGTSCIHDGYVILVLPVLHSTILASGKHDVKKVLLDSLQKYKGYLLHEMDGCSTCEPTLFRIARTI